jgi:hypothetical protein
MIGYKIKKYGLRIKEVRWSGGNEEDRQDNQQKNE